MLYKFIRWARIVAAGKDDGKFPVQQLEYQGKVADGLMLFPYGTHANVPADALAIMFSVGGAADNRAAFAYTPTNRPKLADGEVAFYHPPSGAHMVWRNGGKLEIITDGTIDITCPSLTITGDLTVTGSTALAAVTSNGTDIGDTHTHAGSATAPTGAVSPTGAPV